MPRLGLLLVLATFSILGTRAQRQGCGSSADFIFVLDSSGSLVDQPLRSNNWAFIQEFLEIAVLNIADTIERDYPGAATGLRFALVQFRDVGVITLGLDDFPGYRDAARIMRQATNLGGQTNMAAGLEEAENLLAPRRSGSVRKAIIIVVSDWSPFNDTVRANSINIARRLEREYDATIVTVGVLGSVDQQFLMQVSTNGRNVMSEDHQRLLTHISPLISVACETPDQGGPNTSCERDVVFVLDASVSLSQQQDFDRLKTFVAQVAGNIFQTARDTRMGVVVFSTDANVTIPLQLYTQEFAAEIQGIEFDPKLTNHADALRKAREMLSMSMRSRFVIIFTDGMTTQERGAERIVAETMREEGINIIAFGVSDKIDFATLEKLVGSDKRSTNIFWSPDFQSNMISKLNTLTQTAESCPARELPCDVRPPDVVVALDASGSIKDKGPDNWRLMQNFGVAVVENLRRTYFDSRVGVLIFSDYAMELIGLTDNTQQVIQRIRDADHINGFTNEADAFRVAGRMLGQARNPSYKYVIMVTDGQPTLEIGREVQEAEELERQGITRIMIGVTNDIKRDRLTNLGSSPPERYVLFTEDFNTLNAVSLVTSVVTAAGQCQRPVQPTPPPRQCFGADVILLMDSSGSIEEKGRGNFNLLKSFVANLARNIASRYSETRFGLVLFSDQGRVVSSLNRYTSILEFVNTVNQQTYSGYQTNIASALRVARNDAVRNGRNNPQIIIFTDGEPTAETDQTIREADLARQANIKIAAVGITFDVDSQTLTRITGSSDRVYMTPQFTDLQNEIVEVTQVACNDVVRAIAPCSGNLEVVFALDASKSIEDISPTAWQDALNFVNSAISGFYSFNRNSRFGLVVFSDRARTQIGLTGDINRLPALVNSTTYDRGRTNIADSIQVARDQVLYQSRPGASKILILITDGEPNERITDTVPQANRAKADGIVIVTVGITTNGPDYNLLSEIASSPLQVIRSLSFSELNSRIGSLILTTCNSFTTRPNPNALPDFTTRPSNNRPGFPAQQPTTARLIRTTPRVVFDIPSGCSGGYIVLVLDVSRRLHYKTLPNRGIQGLGEMAANIVDVMSRLYRDAKFAVVTYEGRATIVRDFNAYRSSDELEAYLRQLSYAPVYESNIAEGFARAKDVIDRARATSSMVILVSDGVTTIDVGIERTRADELRSAGSEVLVIAVSKTFNPGRLEGITRRNPDHFVAQTYSFDANRLSPYYRPCNRNPNFVAAIRNDAQKVCPDEVVFVIDSSNSMNGNDWDKMKEYVVSLIDRFAQDAPAMKFGSVLFSDNAHLGYYLTNDLPDIKLRTEGLRHLGGGTNIARALSSARQYVFNGNSAKKMLVLLVDGDPSVEVNAAYREADLLRNEDIDIVVVGITNTPSRYTLERIAGSADRVIRAYDFNYLQDEVQKVVDLGCKAGDNDVNQQQRGRSN